MEYSFGNKYYYKKNQFLHYREIGQGEKVLILLHGFGASSRAWDDLIPYIDTKAYKIIAIDLIGYGYSSIPSDHNFSMEANASAITSFIGENLIRNYSILGHSFGGGVTLNIALNVIKENIDEPESIILLDAAAYNTGLPSFVKQLKTPVINCLILGLIPPRTRAKFTLENLYFDKTKVTEKRIERYAYFFRIPGNDITLMKSAEQIVPKNYNYLIQQYKYINTPTLIIWGENDNALSIDGGYRLKKEIEGSKLVIIKDCGHNVQEECPKRVAVAIKDFLASIEK
ncbi:MAG: alpha/beta hydrolase [Nodosilinea sp.]